MRTKWRIVLGIVVALGALVGACETGPTMTVAATPHPAASSPPHEGPSRVRGCGPSDRHGVTVLTGDVVRVTFDKPLEGKATNQFWIVLVPSDAPESATQGRVILPRNITSAELPTSAPGDYEVRLHGRYPEKDYALLSRVPVKVEGWPVKTGASVVVPSR
jgi:hypothetical protein